MRSAADDLTARARIRDAAVARFGRDGFGVGLRVIAADAGVSPALVIHHFGSKDGLRTACDEHVLARILEEKRSAIGTAAPSEVMAKLATLEQYATVFAYVVRCLLEGGTVAAHFIEGLVQDAEKYLVDAVDSGSVLPSRDPAGRARLLIAMSVGSLVMAQADAAAGRSPAPTEQPAAAMEVLYRRIMLASLELYTQGLFADTSYLDAYLAYEETTHE